MERAYRKGARRALFHEGDLFKLSDVLKDREDKDVKLNPESYKQGIKQGLTDALLGLGNIKIGNINLPGSGDLVWPCNQGYSDGYHNNKNPGFFDGYLLQAYKKARGIGAADRNSNKPYELKNAYDAIINKSYVKELVNNYLKKLDSFLAPRSSTNQPTTISTIAAQLESQLKANSQAREKNKPLSNNNSLKV